MRVIFRVDSGIHIGQGHLARCRNLAQLFLKEGWDVHFIVRDHKNRGSVGIASVHEHVLSPGVSDALPSGSEADYGRWLGVEVSRDLEQVEEIVASLGGVDVFVTDHYALDGLYQSRVEAKCRVAIDDIANRNFDCDLIVNQNPNVSAATYEKLVNGHPEFLLGPMFAPLDSRFEIARGAGVKPLVSVSSVAVFKGGSDPTGETLKVVRAYASGNFPFALNVLISDKHRDFEAVRNVAETRSAIRLRSSSSDMAEFWVSSDVAIGAVGVSQWERSCLGKATFLSVGADNQRAIAEWLDDHGSAVLVGDGRKLTDADWFEVLTNDVTNLALVNALRATSFDLCDGQGAKRVLARIHDHLKFHFS